MGKLPTSSKAIVSLLEQAGFEKVSTKGHT